jgi:uncharacterized protein (TIGR02217 family)
MAFHDIRFPSDISRGAHGGPERRTDIVVLGSGAEERNARWADSRRAYNAGYGIKSLDDLYAVITFFEERRGRLHGFRWRDHLDWKSCAPEATTSPLDQLLGLGTGTKAAFQLIKSYGRTFAPWQRTISKPMVGSVIVAVAGAVQPSTTFAVDAATGLITFAADHVPVASARVTAGYQFDVPVRFDTDRLDINMQGFRHGAIQSIPIVEIRV